MKISQWLTAMTAIAVLLAGCGEGSGAQTVDVPLPNREIDVTLDGYEGPENVGIVMAEQRGYFDDADIDVWTRLPLSRTAPAKYVAQRRVALAISHEPEVVMERDKGAPLISIGSLVSEPTAALIWLGKSKIDGVEDLKGKTIAITGMAFERSLLENVLGQAGMSLDDVRVVRADYDLIPALLGGRADAILGNWNLEGALLEAGGAKPVITRLQNLGVPSYEEFVLISRSDRLEAEPGWIRRFMSAVERGTAAAIEDPEAAARLVARATAQPLSWVKPQIEATLPLLSSSGSMDPDRAEELTAWMGEEGIVEEEPPVDELLTNDYLPSQP